MSFAAPWVLAGLVAAAVPILLHLVARREPPTVIFPAVRYLEDVTRRHQRRLNLQHVLLLLVRTALIIVLVLVAAGPSRAGGGPGGHAPAALVLVVDNSLSSGAIRGGTPTLDRLRTAAQAVLGRAEGSDELWLITADGSPRRGTPAALSAMVDSLASLAHRLDLGAALSTAADLLASASHPGEIIVLTDLQVSALSAAEVSTPVVIGVPEGPVPINLGIASIETGPQPWGVGGRLSVAAAGRAERPSPLTVFLDGRAVRQLLLEPGGTVTTTVAPPGAGWHAVEARLDPDELRLDDEAVAAVQVAPPARVTWDESDRYLGAAAEVLLANGRLARGVEISLGSLAGGAAVVFPPADPAALGALNRALVARGVGWQFGPLEQVAITTDSASLLTPQPVLRRHRLLASGSGQTGVLLTAGGEPWLVRSGQVVLVGSRFDPEWTGLPVSAAFMPFMDALLNRVVRGEVARLAGTPGVAAALPDLVTAVASPAGERRVEGGARFIPAVLGLHWLLQGADTVGVLEVNPDPRESDLAPAEASAVRALWPTARVESPERAAALAFTLTARADLRGPFLWAALILALLDLVLGGAFRRTRA